MTPFRIMMDRINSFAKVIVLLLACQGNIFCLLPLFFLNGKLALNNTNPVYRVYRPGLIIIEMI